MRAKIFKLIIIIFLIVRINTLFAQNTGYGGKRFLFKTDLIDGVKSFITGADLEIVILQNTTLSVGFKSFSSNVKQKYQGPEYPAYDLDDDHPLRMPDKALVKTNCFNLEIRQYFQKKSILPTPNGRFFYLSTNIGSIDVEGNYYESLILNGYLYDLGISDDKGEYISYVYKNVDFFSIEVGTGHQFFITRFLTAGFKIGLDYTKIINDLEGIPEQALSGVAKRYGSNLFGFKPSVESQYYPYEKEPANSCIGLSFYCQIGIILF